MQAHIRNAAHGGHDGGSNVVHLFAENRFEDSTPYNPTQVLTFSFMEVCHA